MDITYLADYMETVFTLKLSSLSFPYSFFLASEMNTFSAYGSSSMYGATIVLPSNLYFNTFVFILLFCFSVGTYFIYYLFLFSLTFEEGKQPSEKERGLVCPQL